jgi:hypothetical protein
VLVMSQNKQFCPPSASAAVDEVAALNGYTPGSSDFTLSMSL